MTPMSRGVTSKTLKKRAPRKWSRKYLTVRFDFLDWNSLRHEKVIHLPGTVTVTRHTMVLEVNESDDRSFVVTGTRRRDGFAGRYRDRSGRVRAAWFKSGAGPEVWVGLWVENGTEYVFVFHIPPVEPGSEWISLENFEESFDDDDFEKIEKLPEYKKRPMSRLAETLVKEHKDNLERARPRMVKEMLKWLDEEEARTGEEPSNPFWDPPEEVKRRQRIAKRRRDRKASRH
jgi:hypothetical protein